MRFFGDPYYHADRHLELLKVDRVINSCETIGQVLSAKRYVDLHLKKWDYPVFALGLSYTDREIEMLGERQGLRNKTAYKLATVNK